MWWTVLITPSGPMTVEDLKKAFDDLDQVPMECIEWPDEPPLEWIEVEPMNQMRYAALVQKFHDKEIGFDVSFMELTTLLGAIRLLMDHPDFANNYNLEMKLHVEKIRNGILSAMLDMGVPGADVHAMDVLYASEAGGATFSAFRDDCDPEDEGGIHVPSDEDFQRKILTIPPRYRGSKLEKIIIDEATPEREEDAEHTVGNGKTGDSNEEHSEGEDESEED
jgi:hypothetical protein